MNLQPYQLCRWCDGLTDGWKKGLFLSVNALLLLLAVLSRTLRVPLTALLLLADATVGLYLLYRRLAFGAEYQRVPCPRDAQAETVLIDASLIGEGTRLRAAAQPFDAAEALSLRLGSGALLLGTAMTLTADELSPAERSAVLSAVQQLNIKPDRMRSHSPVLARMQEGRVSRVTVRDGGQERTYFMGDADAVAALTPMLWDGQVRPVNNADRARLADTARYIAQGNCHVLAWATSLADEPPVFLGMAGLGASVRLQAAQDVSALRAQGLTVMLAPEDGCEEDTIALRRLLELPDHHAREDIRLTAKTRRDSKALCVTRTAGESLLTPVTDMRQRFYALERILRRFTLLLGWPMVLSVLFGCWPSAAVSAVMMLYAALVLGIGNDGEQPGPRVWIGLIAATACARLLLSSQTDAVLQMCGGCLTVLVAMACAFRLSGKRPHLHGQGSLQGLSLVGVSGVYVLLSAVICGASAGVLLLPLAFSMAVAAVMILLLLCEHRIFR